MARKRKIGGEIFELLKYAPSKNSANRTAEKERRSGSKARVIKFGYKGYPYSVWVKD